MSNCIFNTSTAAVSHLLLTPLVLQCPATTPVTSLGFHPLPFFFVIFLLRLKHQCLHLWLQPDSLALLFLLSWCDMPSLAGTAAYRCAASHLASSVTNNLLAFGARLATASKTEYTTTTDPSGYSYDNKVHGPVQRPRYIHRGSGRRFVYSGSAIPSLWTAGRAGASQLRHQSDAAHTTNINLCFLKKHTAEACQTCLPKHTVSHKQITCFK